MPYCRKCGAKLKENAKFCHVCGISVVAVTHVPSTHMKGKELPLPYSIRERSGLQMLKDRRLLFAAILTVTADFLVFTIGGDSVLLPLRWFVGSVFSLIFPGYCLLGALLLKKELGIAETICLSVTLSFGILALNGLLVNSLFGKIDLVLLMLFLSLEVLALTMVTVFRYQGQSILKGKIDAARFDVAHSIV
jgi:uncharacterized membrane protein